MTPMGRALSKRRLPLISKVHLMSDLKIRVFDAIASVIGNPDIAVDDNTALIGDSSVLDSMKLVEVCLALEDLSADMGFDFDWTTDAAMSRSRGIFKTAGTLATEFARQMDSKH